MKQMLVDNKIDTRGKFMQLPVSLEQFHQNRY